MNDAKRAALHINTARKLGPFFDVRFTIFCQDKTQEQISKSANVTQGKSLTLMNFVEFQKNYTAARKYDQLTRVLMHRFWNNLLSHSVKLTVVSPAIDEIDKASSKAKVAYEALIEKFSHSVDLLKSFASFLEDVLGENEKAAEYRKRALREMRKKSKRAKKRRKLLEREGVSSLEQDNEQEEAMQVFENDRAQRNHLEQSDESMGTVGAAMLSLSTDVVFTLSLILLIIVSVFDITVFNHQEELLHDLVISGQRIVAVSQINHVTGGNRFEELTQLNLEVESHNTFQLGSTVVDVIGKLIGFLIGYSGLINFDAVNYKVSFTVPFSQLLPTSPSIIPSILLKVPTIISRILSQLSFHHNPTAIDSLSEALSVNSLSEYSTLVHRFSLELGFRLFFVGLLCFICISLFIYILIGPLKFVLSRVQYNRNVALNLLLRIPKNIIQHIIATRFVDEDARGIPNEHPVGSLDLSAISVDNLPSLNLSSTSESANQTAMTSSRDLTSSGGGKMSSSTQRVSDSRSKSTSRDRDSAEITVLVSHSPSGSGPSSSENSVNSYGSFTSHQQLSKSKSSKSSQSIGSSQPDSPRLTSSSPSSQQPVLVPVKRHLKQDSSKALTAFNVMSNKHLKSSVSRGQFDVWKKNPSIKQKINLFLKQGLLNFLRVTSLIMVLIGAFFVLQSRSTTESFLKRNQLSLDAVTSVHNVTFHRINHLEWSTIGYLTGQKRVYLDEFLKSIAVFPDLTYFPEVFSMFSKSDYTHLNSLSQVTSIFENWCRSLLKISKSSNVNDFDVVEFNAITNDVKIPDERFFGFPRTFSHFLNNSAHLHVSGTGDLISSSISSVTSRDFSSLIKNIQILGKNFEVKATELVNINRFDHAANLIAFTLYAVWILIIFIGLVCVIFVITTRASINTSKLFSNLHFRVKKFSFRTFVMFLVIILLILLCLSMFLYNRYNVSNSVSRIDSANNLQLTQNRLIDELYSLSRSTVDFALLASIRR
ncbi:hypothetical protein GEMRC1_002598 [Eukaryota sp. GEM-RC1]